MGSKHGVIYFYSPDILLNKRSLHLLDSPNENVQLGAAKTLLNKIAPDLKDLKAITLDDADPDSIRKQTGQLRTPEEKAMIQDMILADANYRVQELDTLTTEEKDLFAKIIEKSKSNSTIIC